MGVYSQRLGLNRDKRGGIFHTGSTGRFAAQTGKMLFLINNPDCILVLTSVPAGGRDSPDRFPFNLSGV